VSYENKDGDQSSWIQGDSIDGFLKRFLVEQGYSVVGVLDPLTGLEFADGNAGDMEKAYQGVGQGEHARAETEWERPAEGQATQPAGARRQANVQPRDDEIGSAIIGLTRAIGNRRISCAFVINLASRLITTPGYPSEREHRMLAHLLKGSWGGMTAKGEGGRNLKNLIVLVCDKLNDFPPFLYVNNPRARSIQVDKPDRAEREAAAATASDHISSLQSSSRSIALRLGVRFSRSAMARRCA